MTEAGSHSADLAVRNDHEPPPVTSGGRLARALRTWWGALVGAVGFVVGLAPHVLHHVGLLGGTALVAGAGGTALFGVVGFVASIPLLLRLRRRFDSWRAPAIGLAVFTAMFLVSALVIGPAITGVPAGRQPTHRRVASRRPRSAMTATTTADDSSCPPSPVRPSLGTYPVGVWPGRV